MEYAGYLALGILGIWFRYHLGMTQACKTIGVEISNSGNDTGLQDAITPPSLTNSSLLVWGSVIAVAGWLLFEFTWMEVLIGIAVFFVISVIAGATFIPKPDSSRFLKYIYDSLIQRYETYKKQNDNMRAEAIKLLISKVEERYDEQL